MSTISWFQSPHTIHESLRGSFRVGSNSIIFPVTKRLRSCRDHILISYIYSRVHVHSTCTSRHYNWRMEVYEDICICPYPWGMSIPVRVYMWGFDRSGDGWGRFLTVRASRRQQENSFSVPGPER